MGKGRPPTVSDEEILQFIHESDDPFVFTSDVAEGMGFGTTAGMYKRLDSLEREGYLNVKGGGNVKIWWLSDAGVERVEEGP